MTRSLSAAAAHASSVEVASVVGVVVGVPGPVGVPELATLVVAVELAADFVFVVPSSPLLFSTAASPRAALDVVVAVTDMDARAATGTVGGFAPTTVVPPPFMPHPATVPSVAKATTAAVPMPHRPVTRVVRTIPIPPLSLPACTVR